jgi:glycosyltransferase involved in cell wall biosynthesis
MMESVQNGIFFNATSFASALHAAVVAFDVARVQYVLFVHDSVVVMATDVIDALRVRLEADANVGLVAPMLLEEDLHTVSDIGVAFALESTRPSAEVSWWREDSAEGRNAALPHASLRGVARTDARVRALRGWSPVSGVSLALAMMRRADWMALGAMPVHHKLHTMRLLEADLASGVQRELSRRVEVTASVSAIRFRSARDSTAGGLGGDDEIDAFVARHGTYWEKKLRETLLAEIHLTYDMECGLGAVLGFTTEAVGFVVALEQLVDIKVKVAETDNCLRDLRTAGLEAYQVAAVHRMIVKRSPPRDSGVKRVLLMHHDPGRYLSFTDTPQCIVGRSMFETDSIPTDWIDSCNSNVHEIFVPSTFNQKTFADAGVKTPLTVIYEPLDTYRFDISRFSGEHAERALDIARLPQLRYLRPPAATPSRNEFRFVSVGKWEARKAFDELMNAYFDAFDSDSDVALWLRTKLDDKGAQEFERTISDFCTANNRSRDSLPQVVVANELLSYDELPNFYRAFDVLVSASHGEGWGLPLAEAMAMGLPVIAIEWGGSATLLNGTGAIAVPYELTDARVAHSNHKWASAKRADLARELQEAWARGRADARQRGAASSVVVRERFAQLAVARTLANRLPQLKCEALTSSAGYRRPNWFDRSNNWRSPPRANAALQNNNNNNANAASNAHTRVPISVI